MTGVRIETPRTKVEIQRQLRSVADQTADYWSSFDAETFFAPLGDAWSPAENVRHLVQSNRPVVKGLKAPKLALILRFGLRLKGSRSFDEVVGIYRAALGDGLKAGGPYVPDVSKLAPSELARDELVAKNRYALDSIAAALEPWSEGALDRLCVAHPALGKMTVREILFFTIYHNAHHVESVSRKVHQRPRVPGILRGMVGEGFMEPLPEEELKAWE